MFKTTTEFNEAPKQLTKPKEQKKFMKMEKMRTKNLKKKILILLFFFSCLNELMPFILFCLNFFGLFLSKLQKHSKYEYHLRVLDYNFIVN